MYEILDIYISISALLLYIVWTTEDVNIIHYLIKIDQNQLQVDIKNIRRFKLW